MFDWKHWFGKQGFGKKISAAPGKGTAAEPGEDPAETLYASVRSYVALITAIADSAPDTPKQLKEDYGHHLRKIRDEVAGSTPTSKLLYDAERRTEAQLKGFGKGLEKHVQQHEKDVKEVMALVASMADSIASHEKQYTVRFKGIAKKLRLLTTANDIADIRQRLTEEIGQLDKYVEDMARDTRVALERVNTNLLAIRDRQNATPWLEREPDSVTKLPGRPVAREAIETRQRAGAAFSIARFAVEQYPLLAQRHRAQDLTAAVSAFALRLSDELKGAAALARWSESEFVAIFDCHLPELAGKLSEVEQKLAGAYQGVPLAVAASAVQPFRGETVEQLMARLESASRQPVGQEA